MTNNGNIGQDSFAVSSSTTYNTSEIAFRAFDNLTTTVWTANASNCWFLIYNPYKLCVTGIDFTNWSQASYVRACRSGAIQGSNDNVTFTDIYNFTNSNYTASSTWNINFDNTQGYKYYKLNLVGDGSYCRISKMDLHANRVYDILI